MSERKLKYKIRVFCDFDGTIVLQDAGDEFFRKFSTFEPYHTQLVEDKISIREYYDNVCSNIDKTISKVELDNFIETIDLDPYFIKFKEFCKEKDIDLFVISDGFDIYINQVLKKNGIDNLKIFCNLLIEKEEHYQPFFPLASESCNCRSGSCKRNSMLRMLDEDTISVFIGDGLSDYCVVEYADIVFAKKKLAAYCNRKKIPHYNYSNFFDICRLLNNILLKNKMKKRNQAELLRKKAFETE